MTQTSLSSLLIIDKLSQTETHPDQSLLKQIINSNDFDQSEVVLISSPENSIGIDQIRDLIMQASYATFSAKTKRLFIIWQAEKMTLASQNSLLKILEEPPKNNQIILVVGSMDSLLETIISRCLVVNHQSEPNKVNDDQQLFAQVLSGQTSYSELIDIAEQYQEKNQALALVDNFCHYVHQQPNYPSKKAVQALQKLQQSKNLLVTNINSKLVLELMFFELKRL